MFYLFKTLRFSLPLTCEGIKVRRRRKERKERGKSARPRYEKHARRKEKRETGNGGEKRIAGESRVDCKSNRCRRLASKQAALATPTSLLLSFPSFLSLSLFYLSQLRPTLSLSLSFLLPLFFYLSLFTLATTLEQIPAR